MNVQNATILITGANRGLGAEFARQALARGARKVYAAARDPSTITTPGLVPVRLDVTDAAGAAELARELGDVDIVVNNAGIAETGAVLDESGLESMGRMMATNVFGLLNVSRAFAPVLARNGGGAFVNILSIASWASSPVLANYAVSKSAAWSATNGLRDAVRPQGTQVLGVHVGFIDTDLTRGFEANKLQPATVVDSVFAALEAGDSEVLVDQITRQVKRGLSANTGDYTLVR